MSPILINGQWQGSSGAATFSAIDPATGIEIAGEFPVSNWEDCDRLLTAACRAADELESLPTKRITAFLNEFALQIESDAEALATIAASETGLPVVPRLRDVELPRTVDQLRQAAAAASDHDWRLPTADRESGIYSQLGSLGPIWVLGPSNFPFAFNAISGGDFAAAIAAGNPVIAKAHPSHPETSRRLAEHSRGAAEETDFPSGGVQMFYDIAPEVGLQVAADPRLAAIAFTGSRSGGLALKQVADAVGKPIYLEMSSVNPVFFLPNVLRQQSEALASELAGSVLLGAGQFCTCPNLFVMPHRDAAEKLLSGVAAQMSAKPAGLLLNRGVADQLTRQIEHLTEAGAEIVCGGALEPGNGFRFQHTLLKVSGQQFLANANALQSEAFGPTTLGVVADDSDQLLKIAASLEGSLTGSVYSAEDGSDDELTCQLMQILRRRVGRLLNDKMPTGVAVSPAMNHGGPFPATSHPGFTSVGIPASLRRFTKLDCYDNVRSDRLPPALRDLSQTES